MTQNSCGDEEEICNSKDVEYRFGEYPKDYFDLIIIDECHRGGANSESNWRAILDYFSPAVQLGLTATPKRDNNADTYSYFGEPVYIYSLKDGINDGFLTPFKVKRIKTTLDDYIYTNDDTVIKGNIEEGRLYKESDFNRNIEIREREEKRVKIFMNDSGVDEKAIVFCTTQEHAAMVRDIINQNKPEGKDVNYCVRVTANDGEMWEKFLREFQDNEKIIPTILTTSQKLSTGVDARNIRNIVLMRPVNSMIEFKQIVGRGTRMFDGKEFFTIYDFVNAYHHFSDPEWDGEPEGEIKEPEPKPTCSICGKKPCVCEKEPPTPCEKCGNSPCICNKKEKVKIKLRNGKELEIQHIVQTSFWSADGKPVSAEEFLNNLAGELPKLFEDENKLRDIWSNPETRETLLVKLEEIGFGAKELDDIKKIIDAEKSDVFDVLEYIFNSEKKPISRKKRVEVSRDRVLSELQGEEKSFVEFILERYIEIGAEELSQDKLAILIKSKYQSQEDGIKKLGGDIQSIKSLFLNLQKDLYSV